MAPPRPEPPSEPGPVGLLARLRLGARLAHPEYHWVTSRIAVGAYPSPWLVSCLVLDGVEAALDVSGVVRDHPGRKFFQVVKRPLIDGPGNSPHRFHGAVSALDRLLESNRRVYVHCVVGVNRAPSVVVGWLAWHGWPLAQAMARIAERRPHASIHPAILELLHKTYGSAAPSSPNGSLSVPH